MEKLRKKFDSLYATYQQRLTDFKSKINAWKSNGNNKHFQVGTILLAQADDAAKKILSNEITDHKAFKEQLKRFTKAYHELNELSKPMLRQWIEAIVVALVLAIIFRNFIFGLYHVPTGSAERTILVGDRIWGNKMRYFFNKPQRGDLVIFDNPEFPYEQSNGLRSLWQRYVGFPVPLLGLSAGPDNWVKRVIAIPGDTIEGRIENEKTVIYLNGKKLSEPYVNPYPLLKMQKSSGFYDGETFGPLPIPSFLRYKQTVVRYTFDPSRPLDDQPYYYFNDKDVLRKWGSQEYDLDDPFTPSYTSDYSGQRCVDTFGPFTLEAGKYWVMGDSRKNSRDSRFWLFLDEKLIHGRASFIIYSIDSEESMWIFEFLKHPVDFWKKSVRWNRFFKGLRQS